MTNEIKEDILGFYLWEVDTKLGLPNSQYPILVCDLGICHYFLGPYKV